MGSSTRLTRLRTVWKDERQKALQKCRVSTVSKGCLTINSNLFTSSLSLARHGQKNPSLRHTMSINKQQISPLGTFIIFPCIPSKAKQEVGVLFKMDLIGTQQDKRALQRQLNMSHSSQHHQNKASYVRPSNISPHNLQESKAALVAYK